MYVLLNIISAESLTIYEPRGPLSIQPEFHLILCNEIESNTSVRETDTCPLANASAFWAGRVENWPGQVEFYIEHIWDICFRASAPKIKFPTPYSQCAKYSYKKRALHLLLGVLNCLYICSGVDRCSQELLGLHFAYVVSCQQNDKSV